MNPPVRFAIADDHEIVRKGVIDIVLSFGGFELYIEAVNGKDLYEQILAAPSLPDIVLMDISMPEWNGYETLDAIRKVWPKLKVLVLTMHKHELAIIQMFRNGANGYILKNSPPKELQQALKSILDTGLYFSEIASVNVFHRLQNSSIMPSLSEKEIKLLKLCHTDLTYKEIADRMEVSERSVAGHRITLFEKLGVNSRAGLVVCAIQMGLIPVD